MKPSYFAIAVAIAGSLLVSDALAQGIHLRTHQPGTTGGLGFSWGTGEQRTSDGSKQDVDMYELLFGGGASVGMVGGHVSTPIAWIASDSDTNFLVGNIGLGIDVGRELDIGGIGVGIAGGFTGYVPTASEGDGDRAAHGSLLGMRLMRPGYRMLNSIPLEFALGVSANVAIVQFMGEFAVTVGVPKEDADKTITWVHGGLGAKVDIASMFALKAEYTALGNDVEGYDSIHQISIGAGVDVMLFQIGVDARFPVGGKQLFDAPVILGVNLGVNAM